MAGRGGPSSNLPNAIEREWRTPLSSDSRKGVYLKDRPGRPEVDSLIEQVRSWPTPTVEGDRNRAAYGGKSGNGLETAVKLAQAEWPTPTATRYGSQNNGCPGDGREVYATAGKPSPDTIAAREGGMLNPTWVEALMGIPMQWTDVPIDSATLMLFEE